MLQLSQRYRHAREILVFLLIMAALLACLMPAHRHIRDKFALFEGILREAIRSETGLDISFDSASPGIIRNLTFRNVTVSSAEDGSEIFRANRIAVSLKLLKLLRGDFSNCIRRITVENGKMELDLAGSNPFLSQSFAEDESGDAPFEDFADSAGEAAPSMLEQISSVAQRFFASGATVNVRNFSILAQVAETEASIHIGRARINIDEKELAVKSDLSLTWNLESISSIASSLEADLSVTGEVAIDLSSGFASLSIASISFGNIYLSKIGLVAGLQDGVVSVTSIQEGQPLSLSATLDTATKSAEAYLSCENLLFFRWLSSGSRRRAPSVLEGMALSASASLLYSAEEGLQYLADGRLDFPAGFLDTSGGTLGFDFSGDLARADIARLSLFGDDFDADFSGSVSFETLLADGLLSVRRFALPGNALEFSGDFSIESSEKAAALSVPILNINRAVFYNVEGSADFSNESQYEFALSADDDLGAFLCEAVFSSGEESFLQLYAAFDSASAENIIAAVPRRLLNDEAFAPLSGALSPLALTAELYCSTDFERFSYNSPRLIIASQEEGGIYFIASVTGTESGADITDISTSPAGIPVNGNVYAAFESEGEFLFFSDFSVSGIPYSLTGVYADRLISASGDYGISFLLRLPDSAGRGSGSVFFSELPVQVGPAVLSLSLDADFAKRRGGSWRGNINSFSAREASGLTNLDTVLQASGAFDSSSVSLRSISLSDELSSLSGFASVGILKDSFSDSSRITLDLSLRDKSGGESITAGGSVTSGSGDTLFEGQCSVHRLPLMRFSKGQQAGNFVSADVSVSGSPDMMLASINIPELSLRLGKADMNASALAMYEDGNVILRSGSAAWGNFRASGIQADFSTADLSGTVGALFSGTFAGSAFSMDLQGDFQGNPLAPSGEDAASKANSNSVFGWAAALSDAARSFSVAFELSGITWRDIIIENPLHCAIDRAPGITAAYAGDNNELSGLLLDDGAFTVSLLGDIPVQFQADGSAFEGALDVDVSGVDIDMARLWPVLGWNIIEFDGGHVTGNFHIGGRLTDPDFEGVLNANAIVVRSPDYFPTPFDPAYFLFVADGSEIWAPKFIVTGNGGKLEAEAVFYFNRWIPEQIDLFVRNIEESRAAAVVNNKYVRARGDVFCDIVFTWTPDLMKVTGNAGFENGNFAIRFENIEEGGSGASEYNVIADLNVHMGRKVEFRWPSGTFPVMRALVQSDDPFRFAVNTARGEYSLKGLGALKGGDFFYFKRSFYLRQGTIVFDETQDHFDPRISLRAEVRERDENGSPVRITMTVDNDPLSSFNPVFASDPFKNQHEIMEILGQIATADTASDNPWRELAITGTDLLAQLGVLRPAENFIRDKLHLDIFSVRTLALQNAIFGNSLTGATSSNRWTAGNFLDNTTVYFGKYFGSVIYVDALLQFSYYDTDYYQDRIYRNTFFPTVFGNLLFLPEIGIELDTPFAHIRWGISPVPDNNNITLSWRFAY